MWESIEESMVYGSIPEREGVLFLSLVVALPLLSASLVFFVIQLMKAPMVLVVWDYPDAMVLL